MGLGVQSAVAAHGILDEAMLKGQLNVVRDGVIAAGMSLADLVVAAENVKTRSDGPGSLCAVLHLDTLTALHAHQLAAVKGPQCSAEVAVAYRNELGSRRVSPDMKTKKAKDTAPPLLGELKAALGQLSALAKSAMNPREPDEGPVVARNGVHIRRGKALAALRQVSGDLEKFLLNAENHTRQ